MTRSVALSGLVGGLLLIALAYAAVFITGRTPAWTVWSYMIGTSTTMLAMMVLGAARGRGGISRLIVPFAMIYLVLLGGFGAVLVLPAETAGSALLLGLPVRTAIVLYGIGILPLFLLPLAYAFTFDSMTLREDDLERVADVRRAREQAEQRARGETA